MQGHKMTNETNQEPIGTFKAEPQEPVVDKEVVKEVVKPVVDENVNDSNADLQGLINNRDALIREKRAAKDEATGFKSQLEDMGNENVTLNKRIDDLLVENLANDIVRLINPVEGATAFVMDTIKKQISLGTKEDQRSALIKNNLTTSELVTKFQQDNKAICLAAINTGGDANGGGFAQGSKSNGSSTSSTTSHFGLK